MADKVQDGGRHNRPGKYSKEIAGKWAEMYSNRMSILAIAERERVDPGTVAKWLNVLGVHTVKGRHFVKQQSMNITGEVLHELRKGPDEVLRYLESRVWGIQFSKSGKESLSKYCRFVKMHEEGKGVEEISGALNIHRSTVLQWRRGTDRPYFVRCMETATRTTLKEGWRLLPMKLDSGGNVPSDWMMVPERLVGESDVREVLEGIVPLPSNEALAVRFGVRDASSAEGKFEAFAYVLGIMLGDAAKYGGVQNRFTSMNLDLQLSKNRPSNLDLGDYAAMCVQTLGIHMHRNSDKMPTGATARAMFPAPAYRWNSSRSPLIAWMFNVCLGLGTEELTSINPVNMEWILRMPKTFIKRFVQGVADSDGTARPYVVEIASMPNAEFVTKLLSTLGMKTARTVYEKGAPMRTSVLNAEAASLPIFNEFAKSYRYRYLMGRASGMLDRAERSGRT